MVDNPLLFLLIGAGLFIVFLAIFILANYLYLRYFVTLELGMKKEKW